MDWKNWFERNAFFVVVSACVATGGVVAGVMEYYSGQKIEIMKEQQASELNDLKTQLGSITRSIGHEEYLDVGKIVVARDRVSPEPNSQYFDDAEFYAPAASGDWVYSESDEATLAQTLLGNEIENSPLVQKAGKIAPIHLWRARQTLAAGGSSPFKSLFPYVYVEKFSFDKMKGAIGSLAADDTPPPAPAPAAKPQSSPGNEFLDSAFRGDVAGKLLTFLLLAQFAAGQQLPTELLNVQKIHNVVYVAERMTLKNVTINKVAYPRYYLYSEIVIISNGEDATMVKTLVPSADPFGNNDSFQYLSRWFNGLRVLVG